MRLVLSGVYPVSAEMDIAGVEVRYKAEKGKVNKEICLSVKEKLEKKYDTEIEFLGVKNNKCVLFISSANLANMKEYFPEAINV